MQGQKDYSVARPPRATWKGRSSGAIQKGGCFQANLRGFLELEWGLDDFSL